MNQPRKVQSRQTSLEQQTALGQQQQEQAAAAREFAGPDELLRHDAIHTPVPPSIAQRLQESLEKSPVPRRTWWRRLFHPHS